MKRSLMVCAALLAAVVAAPVAQAEPILTLNPTVITGIPGQTIGWGFTLTADPTYYISISSAFVDTESNPAVGFFSSDWISLAGGPASGVLAPGGSDWVQAYSASLGTGFGQYTVDSNALPGDSTTGTFLVIYSRYSGDPNSCGSCFVDSQFLSPLFQVDVTATDLSGVPEPGWTAALGVGMIVGVAAWRRARQRRQ